MPRTGASQKRVLAYLAEHDGELPLTSEVAEGCSLRMTQAKNALQRLLADGRVMYVRTVVGSRWKLTPKDVFEPVISNESRLPKSFK